MPHIPIAHFMCHLIFIIAISLAGVVSVPASAQGINVAAQATEAAPQIKSAPIEKVVNIYSYRQPFLIAPLLKSFTAQTGIKTKIIFAKKGLIERAALEGRHSPVDIILTTDISRLRQAGKIAQPVKSQILTNAIAPAYRAINNRWFGLTTRARVAFVSKTRFTATSLTFEELAAPKYKGRICIRSGQHPYNLGLFASMILHHGTAKARLWLAGLKANLAVKPAGNDRTQIRHIYAGTCDIAIANTYYMGNMQTNTKNPEQQKWAQSVRLIFPNAETRGTHVNLSGMVMARYAPHPAAALKLMEFLVSARAQEIYAQTNYEYPVRADTPVSDRVASWGAFKADTLSLDDIGATSAHASRLVDEVRFNQ